MRSGLSGALAVVVLFAVCAPAQELRPISFDSLYLAVPDVEQARDWYMTNMGGNAGEIPERVAFGQWIGEHPLPIQLVFLRSPGAASAQPGAGGFIDNIGFSFKDLDAKIRELQAAGVKVTSPPVDVPGLWKRALIEDPWGTPIELVQDSDLLGLHHVTVVTPDPEATLAWLVHAFGGDRTKLKGQIDAIRYRDLSLFYLFAVKGDQAGSGGRRHPIDHLGWGPLDLGRAVQDLTAMGVKFVSDPNPRGYPSCVFVPAGAGGRGTATSDMSKLSCAQPEQLPHRSVFLEGPDGVRIELVDHLEVIGLH
jgi:catechol 2,3-dioxygenase-like lactoylglutathione lyase family enzyme